MNLLQVRTRVLTKLYFNAACSLFLGAYVWLHGNDLFVLGSDFKTGHFEAAHLKPAFAIVTIAYACYLASDELPRSLKIALTILAPLVAIGLMLAIE
jgi:hypothetical protein